MVVVLVMGIHGLGRLEAQGQHGVERTTGHRQHRRARPHRQADPLTHPFQGVSIDPVGPTHHHQIGRFQLLLEQLLNGRGVIEAGIGQPLGLQRLGIGHHGTGSESLSIHHRHDAIHPRAGADGRPAEGRHQGLGQRQATRFHHDAVELVGAFQQPLHGGDEVVLNGAAEAAVGQLHQASIQFILGTEATAAQQIAIDPHLAEFVHENGKALATVQQQMTQQGGLPCSQETGHHRDRQPA